MAVTLTVTANTLDAIRSELEAFLHGFRYSGQDAPVTVAETPAPTPTERRRGRKSYAVAPVQESGEGQMDAPATAPVNPAPQTQTPPNLVDSKADAPAPKSKPERVAEKTSAEEKPAATPVPAPAPVATVETCREAMKRLSEKFGGIDVCIALLKRFGAGRLSELKAEHYVPFVALAERAIVEGQQVIEGSNA